MLFWKLSVDYREYLFPWTEDPSELASVIQILSRGQVIDFLYSEKEGDLTQFIYTSGNSHKVRLEATELNGEIYPDWEAADAARAIHDNDQLRDENEAA